LEKARGQILGEDGVRVHSMVLPGLASSTSIHFSGPGEVLIIFLLEMSLN
jgi:chloroplast NAD(P)H dehydrogenase